MEPKLFVFDMGDVVIGERHVWHDVFSNFGLDVSNVRELGENSARAVAEALVGNVDEEGFWNLVMKDIGKVEWAGILEASYSCIRTEGTIKIINELKSNGYRVVCGTNNIEPFYKKIRQTGAYDIFPKVYSSFRIGLSKPDKRFWEYIAQEEHVSLNEMFFTDDSEKNIEAAASLGIIAHRFSSPEKLRAALENLGAL